MKNDPQKFSKTTLSNGISIHTQAVPVPFAQINILIPVGSVHSHTGNTGGAPGIAHFLEHLCFGRSKKYPGLHEFEKKLSRCGGNWNAWTNPFFTNFYFEAPAEDFNNLLPGFFSHIFEPLITKEDMAIQQTIISNEGSLRKYYPSGDELGQYRFTKWINGGYYSKEQVYGTPKNLKAITAEQATIFHKHYFSKNIHIIAGGTFDKTAIETIASKIKTNAPTPIATFDPYSWKQREFHTATCHTIDTPVYSWGGFTNESSLETYFAIGFLCSLLTDQNTGILTQWLRNELGWSYGVIPSTWYDKSHIGWIIDIPLPNKSKVSIMRKELHARVQAAIQNPAAINATANQLQKGSCFVFQTVDNRLEGAIEMLSAFGRTVTLTEANTWLATKATPKLLQETYEKHFAPAVSGEVLFVPQKKS